MNNHSILIALHELEGIGWKTIRLLTDAYPNLEELLDATDAELQELGLHRSKAYLIRSQLTEKAVMGTARKYEGSGIVPITVFDERYPDLLLQTSQPPWVLYTRGKLETLERPAIAVVGTRTPTVYGKRVAETLGRDLSESGVCVVSGLARGIDGAAHQGALLGDGSTIAVLGCGIDVIYPREHAGLYHAIADKGLIVSEYPPGTKGAPGMFPLRNRIIAGMSLGTLVVEAAQKSGSNITADMALDESRDIFAVPGPITSPKSAGAHAWIQKGAKLVTGVGDILSEYKHLAGIRFESDHGSRKTGQLTEEELAVVKLLEEGPISIDELVERSQTNFGLLHAILLSLQMKKRIEQLPGSVYALI